VAGPVACESTLHCLRVPRESFADADQQAGQGNSNSTPRMHPRLRSAARRAMPSPRPRFSGSTRRFRASRSSSPRTIAGCRNRAFAKMSHTVSSGFSTVRIERCATSGVTGGHERRNRRRGTERGRLHRTRGPPRTSRMVVACSTTCRASGLGWSAPGRARSLGMRQRRFLEDITTVAAVVRMVSTPSNQRARAVLPLLRHREARQRFIGVERTLKRLSTRRQAQVLRGLSKIIVPKYVHGRSCEAGFSEAIEGGSSAHDLPMMASDDLGPHKRFVVVVPSVMPTRRSDRFA
jgi:hypothetical protein